ncbi:hypothetical protein KI387_036529, partial [Taxus chinensis]
KKHEEENKSAEARLGLQKKTKQEDAKEVAQPKKAKLKAAKQNLAKEKEEEDIKTKMAMLQAQGGDGFVCIPSTSGGPITTLDTIKNILVQRRQLGSFSLTKELVQTMSVQYAIKEDVDGADWKRLAQLVDKYKRKQRARAQAINDMDEYDNMMSAQMEKLQKYMCAITAMVGDKDSDRERTKLLASKLLAVMTAIRHNTIIKRRMINNIPQPYKLRSCMTDSGRKKKQSFGLGNAKIRLGYGQACPDTAG